MRGERKERKLGKTGHLEKKGTGIESKKSIRRYKQQKFEWRGCGRGEGRNEETRLEGRGIEMGEEKKGKIKGTRVEVV